MSANGDGFVVSMVSVGAPGGGLPGAGGIRFIREGVVTVRMDGAVGDLGDRAAHRDIYERLHGAIDTGARCFILDLQDVPYLDSAALGLLVGLAKRVRGEGGSVWIAGAGPSAQRAFEITGLTRIFGMAATVQDALAQLP